MATKKEEYRREIKPLVIDPYKASDEVLAAKKAADDYAANYPAGGQYQTLKDDLLSQYLNRDKFSYDLNADPAYQAYKAQYTREGRNAMADTIADAASLTGGYGNSYAATAGVKIYQSYLDRLNDRVPELEANAYNRYQQEGQDLYNKYTAAQGAYNDLLNEYYQRANFLGDRAQQKYANEYNEYGDRVNNQRYGYESEYQLYRDDIDDDYRQAQFDYTMEQDALDRQRQAELDARAIYESDRDFNEGVRQYNQNYALDQYSAYKSGSGGSKGGSKTAEAESSLVKDLGFSDSGKAFDYLTSLYEERGEEGLRAYLDRFLPDSYAVEDIDDIIESITGKKSVAPPNSNVSKPWYYQTVFDRIQK